MFATCKKRQASKEVCRFSFVHNEIDFHITICYNNDVKEGDLMSDIEKIVREVDSSMAMEGLPLTNEDKDRIRKCLSEPLNVDRIINGLLAKHAVPVRARK